MFCNHCGKSISDNSVFCSHCGSKQDNEKSLKGENKIENVPDNEIKFFLNKNKGFILFYLLWFLMHLILLVAGAGGHACGNGLWPFADVCGTYKYESSALLLYMVIPIITWLIWKLIRKDIEKEIDKIK